MTRPRNNLKKKSFTSKNNHSLIIFQQVLHIQWECKMQNHVIKKHLALIIISYKELEAIIIIIVGEGQGKIIIKEEGFNSNSRSSNNSIEVIKIIGVRFKDQIFYHHNLSSNNKLLMNGL